MLPPAAHRAGGACFASASAGERLSSSFVVIGTQPAATEHRHVTASLKVAVQTMTTTAEALIMNVATLWPAKTTLHVLKCHRDNVFK